MSSLEDIYQQIVADPMNEELQNQGYRPVYTAGKQARIVIIGQAPGLKAQQSGKPWNDLSGKKLKLWLGVTDEQFYDPDLVAIVPMDFYYPGKGKHGDLPPRKGFAEKWHSKLLSQMPLVQLKILVGSYAQKYYLGKDMQKNLTETVRLYKNYLPKYLPMVHPSPLNLRWQRQNPWFEDEVVFEVRKIVKKIVRGLS